MLRIVCYVTQRDCDAAYFPEVTFLTGLHLCQRYSLAYGIVPLYMVLALHLGVCIVHCCALSDCLCLLLFVFVHCKCPLPLSASRYMETTAHRQMETTSYKGKNIVPEPTAQCHKQQCNFVTNGWGWGVLAYL